MNDRGHEERDTIFFDLVATLSVPCLIDVGRTPRLARQSIIYWDRTESGRRDIFFHPEIARIDRQALRRSARSRRVGGLEA